jgi:hypothetical protein
MYLKMAPGDDRALRVLETKKSNYGPISETILLRWRDGVRDGVYVLEPGKGTLERLAAEAEVDHLFIKLLRRFTDQGRVVSDKRSPTHAPTLFAEEPEAQEAKVNKKAFAEAMTRLFAAKKIRVLTEGRPSHPRNRLVETERYSADVILFEHPANTPANGGPTPGQRGGGVTPPIPPTPVGRGQGGVGCAPPPANAKEGEIAIEDEPVMWS